MRRARVLLTVVAATSAAWAAAGSGTWTSAGPPAIILSLAVDPSTPGTVYAGSSAAGAFRSTDGGASWGGFGLGSNSVLALAVAATTPATVYAGTAASGVLTNSASAPNWTSSGLLYNSVQALAALPGTAATVFAGTNVNGVMKTTDSGVTWVKSGLGNTSVLALAIDPVDTATMYAATGSGVFRSGDHGSSWVSANVGLAGVTVRALAVDPAGAGTVYAASTAGVFKTVDGGSTWSPVSSGLTTLSVTSLAVTTWSAPKVYAGTAGGGVSVSTNGGGSWSALLGGLANLSVNALAVAPTVPPTVYAGTAGGVFAYTEPVVCRAPSGLVNNTAVDADPCAKKGLSIAWTAPADWGDSGVGTRTFDVLRNDIPVATGLAETAHAYTDTTAVAYVEYAYAVRADNGCGLSATTVGAIASDTTARPAIQAQPSSGTIWAGHSTLLSVTASGATGYQWYTGTSGDTSHPVVGATAFRYSTPKLYSNTSYWVQVTNACGSTASDTAAITLKWHRLRPHVGRAQ
ncbi:MAG TPA: hypothetical protein VMT19_07090 [Thermoanaerobaculaceae bacterium]|nr:hypothetical protein [Thermoanaerobaculaceae bacterium]